MVSAIKIWTPDTMFIILAWPKVHSGLCYLLQKNLNEFLANPILHWASLMAQEVKSLPAMQETWVRSLGQEDPLEKEMASHVRFLPGESHGQRILEGYSPWGHKESDTTECTNNYYTA